MLDFVTRAARAALEAAWFQKWLVHRRLRPEGYGGLIHVLTGAADYPIHPEVLNSVAVKEVHNKYRSYLLPQAYVEGCPAHPSYPQGHASFVGAQVTILKAFFNESFIIADPVIASSDGLSLLPYQGPPLTVGGELNKLASNIQNGRNTAGSITEVIESQDYYSEKRWPSHFKGLSTHLQRRFQWVLFDKI